MAPDIEALTASAVDTIERWSRRAVRVATWLLVTVVGIICATILLGIMVLSGAPRLVFVVVAAVFGGIGVGVAWLGRWRLGVALREVPQLTSELHQLVSSSSSARQSISAYVSHGEDGSEVIKADPAPMQRRGEQLIDTGRRLVAVRQLIGDNASRFTTLAAVAASAKTFPFLAFTAGAITLGFAVIGTILALVFVATILIS